MSNQENVLTKAYELLLYAIPQLEKFPRSQKFLVADRIETKILDVLDLLIEAYYGKKEQKERVLDTVNLQLEKLRFLIRLSHDMQFFSNQKYGQLSERINEIGRMVGGWRKHLA